VNVVRIIFKQFVNVVRSMVFNLKGKTIFATKVSSIDIRDLTM
jgi:hypothetical protein